MKHSCLVITLLLCVGLAACSGSGQTNANPPAPLLPSVKFVQTANFTFQSPNPTSTYSVTLPGNVTKGDFIVLAFWRNHALNDPGIVSVDDSASDAYLQAVQVDQSPNDSAWIYYANNVAGGSVTATVTVDVADTTAFDIAITEYSGLIGLDSTMTNVSPVDPPSSLASFNSGNTTTQFSDELLVGVGLIDIQKVSAGSGFTSRFTTDFFCVEDNLVTSKGSYNAPFTTDITGLPNIAQYASGAAIAAFH